VSLARANGTMIIQLITGKNGVGKDNKNLLQMKIAPRWRAFRT
jgi:hypothetical protein